MPLQFGRGDRILQPKVSGTDGRTGGQHGQVCPTGVLIGPGGLRSL